jgi:hypothetical protein
VAWVVLEVASLAALLLLNVTRGISYAPIAATALSAAHRAILEDLLAGRPRYLAYSPSLGWTIRPNGQRGPYRANAQGLRADREYGSAPPPERVRVAAFGDSFTHGDDVHHHETWTVALEARHPGVEVLNFGVGGFGLDQAFLRYQHEGRRYRPAVVLIGFATENIFRHVNTFRPFYAPRTGQPLAKPRFVIDGGRLVLVDNPIRELVQYQDLLGRPDRILPVLGARDFYYHSRSRAGTLDVLPSVRLAKVTRVQFGELRGGIVRNGVYNTQAEAFQVTVGILDAFVETVARDGAVPVVLLLPNRWDLERFRRDGTRQYAPLLDHLRARRYRYVDLLEGLSPAVEQARVDDLIPSHYSPLGNQRVATHVAQYLRMYGLISAGAWRP